MLLCARLAQLVHHLASNEKVHSVSFTRLYSDAGIYRMHLWPSCISYTQQELSEYYSYYC